MLLLKFWYCFCLIVLIESLIMLWNQKEYKKNKIIDSSFSYKKNSICFSKTNRIVKEQTNNESMIISELISKVYDKLEHHFKEKKAKFLKSLNQSSDAKFQKTTDELNLKFFDSKNVIDKSIKEIKIDLENYFGDEDLFKKLLKKEESYIVNDFVCFFGNDSFLNYLEIFNEFSYKLFTYKVKPTFNSDTLVFDHKYKTPSGIKIVSQRVKKCFNPTHNSSYSPYECLNDCLIEKDRKSNYMYKITEKKPLILKDEIRDINHEKYCYKKCVVSFCGFGVFYSVNTLKTVSIYITSSEVYLDSNANFRLEFISLIFLFFKISFFPLINNLIKLLFKVIKKENLSQHLLFKAKLFIFLVSFILAILISLNAIANYVKILKNPIKTETTTFSFLPEVFSLVICVPIQLNLKRKNNFTIEQETNKNLFEKYSFKEIENYTNDDLDLILKGIILKRYNQMNEIDFRKLKKVYFKRNEFTSLKLSALSRCFRIEFEIQIIMYSDLVISSEVLIELDEICFYEHDISFGYYNYNATENLCGVFILETFASFSSKSFKHENYFKINKKRIKKSTSLFQKNCTDYSTIPEINCQDKQNCIEKCINQEFLKKYDSLTIQNDTVIDKDDIDNNNVLSTILFNKTYDLMIINECKDKFILEDCFYSVFVESYKKVYRSKIVVINLDFETFELKETESSLPKLLLEILSVEILFFGSNVNAILFSISALLKYLFKINQKWLKCFIFSFCLIGFCLHSLMIFHSILNAPLIDTGFFEEKNPMSYPDFILCFSFKNLKNFKIEKNIKLTGNHLDSLASNFSFKNIFEKVIYINERDETINLKPYSSNPENPYLKLQTYFVKGSKCFEFLIKIEHKKYEFYFRKDAYPLKIYFKREKLKTISQYVFKSKFRSKFEKNDIFLFDLYKNTSLITKYQIKTELTKIKIEDQFKILKNPLSLFDGSDSKNVDNYLENMRNKFFEEFDRFSLKFPIYEKSFDGQIDDDLFTQFFKQKYSLLNPKNQMNFDSDRYIFINFIQTFYLNKSEANNQADLELSPIFFNKITYLTNEEGLGRLAISILNVLSLWYNISPIDLHCYFKHLKHFKHFIKVCYPFIFMHKKLIKLKGYLMIKLNELLL